MSTLAPLACPWGTSHLINKRLVVPSFACFDHCRMSSRTSDCVTVGGESRDCCRRSSWFCFVLPPRKGSVQCA
eukprot:scaffold103296_cov15-Prasinocladus_malaysianus.AAC.1